MEIQVSVLITTFNQKDYIQECIDSCMAQETNFNFEILINDDCSTDGTKDIVLSYAERYPDLVKVLTHQENMYSKGFSPNRDFLYPIAKGKYLALCEGDDYWCDTLKLQRQYDAMENNPDAPFCVHSSKNINATNNSLISINRPYSKDTVVSRSRLLGEVHGFATASYFIRRSVYDSYIRSGMAYQKAHGDFNMSIYFAVLGPVLYLEKTMSVYRCFAKGSINESIFLAKCNDRYKILERNYLNRCSSLDYLNEITNKEFCDEIDNGKRFCEYNFLYDCAKIKELKTKYSARYKQESLKNRLKLYLKHYFPGLYYVLGKVKQYIYG